MTLPANDPRVATLMAAGVTLAAARAFIEADQSAHDPNATQSPQQRQMRSIGMTDAREQTLRSACVAAGRSADLAEAFLAAGISVADARRMLAEHRDDYRLRLEILSRRFNKDNR